MQGSITVFDGGTYAGDARIEDLQPKEERLISYALDLKIEVDPRSQVAPTRSLRLTSERVLSPSNTACLQTKVYTIRNKALRTAPCSLSIRSARLEAARTTQTHRGARRQFIVSE